jgi:hypothetical protein
MKCFFSNSSTSSIQENDVENVVAQVVGVIRGKLRRKIGVGKWIQVI